jgi:three-Cys-motif partner protein
MSDIVGPWTVLKLELYHDFLDAVRVAFNELREERGEYGKYIESYLVDGFAGQGAFICRETKRRILGSPMVALRSEAFTRIQFIESHKQTYNTLCDRCGELADSILNEDAFDILPIIANIRQDGGLLTALLDPCKCNIPFSLMKKFSKCSRVSIAVNVQASSLTRSKRHKSVADAATEMFNTTEWMNISSRYYGDLYADQMKGLFKHVSRPAKMTNSINSPMQQFVFMSNWIPAVTDSQTYEQTIARHNQKRPGYAHM